MRQRPTEQRIVTVIPARNEAGSVGSVVQEVLTRYPYLDVIVIDDASSDRTAEVARGAGAKVLRAPVRLGYGGAVQTGFKYAYTHDYDLVVLLDADGQHDPECIGALIEKSAEYDMVIGSRFRGHVSYRIPRVRLIGMKLFSAIASAVAGQRITDTSSGFQVLSRRVFSFFALGSYPSDFPDADTIIWVARHGYRVGEVAVKMHPRLAGVSMISGVGSSLKYALKMPLSILVTILRIPSSQGEEDSR